MRALRFGPGAGEKEAGMLPIYFIKISRVSSPRRAQKSANASIVLCRIPNVLQILLWKKELIDFKSKLWI